VTHAEGEASVSNARSPDPPRPQGAREAAPASTQDRLIVGKLLDHGRARHEFHRKGPVSYYVKLLMDGGEQKTIWGAGLEAAFKRSRTQPQPGDHIGVRQNNLDPVSFVVRTRNSEGLVVAKTSTDTPRPRWVVEKLEEFDMRAAAARTLRDPTISRREAVQSHRELNDAYWILDTGQKLALEKWQKPEVRAAFMKALRETLAATLERGQELVRPPAQPERGGPRSRE
jgi:hypothetical protein